MNNGMTVHDSGQSVKSTLTQPCAGLMMWFLSSMLVQQALMCFTEITALITKQISVSEVQLF